MSYDRFKKEDFGIKSRPIEVDGVKYDWLYYDSTTFSGNNQCREFYRNNFPTAYQRMSSRCKKLFSQSYTAESSPRRGIAIKEPSVREPNIWLSKLNEVFIKHYGDLIDEISEPGFIIPDGDKSHRYVAAVHEYFQWAKQGYFGPVKAGALREAQQQYIDIVRDNHDTTFSDADAALALKAILQHLEVDYADLKNKLIPKTVEECVNLANTQGLACGPIQLSKDTYFGGHYDYVLKEDVDRNIKVKGMSYKEAVNNSPRVDKFKFSPKKLISIWIEDQESLNVLKELNSYFQVNIKPRTLVKDGIIYIINKKKLSPYDSRFLFLNTILVRHQVGGITYDSEVKRDLKYFMDYKFNWDIVKPAKTRMIQAPDPIYTTADGMIIQSIDDWYRSVSKSFRTGFYDPETDYELMNNQYKACESRNSTLIPFDYELHDARIHIEWVLNTMNIVYKALFPKEYHHLIEWTMLSYANKIVIVPSNDESKDYMDFISLTGGIGSGANSTNNFGSTGTRQVASGMNIQKPDVFLFHSDAGCSKGDDTEIETSKRAVIEHGVKGIVELANSCIKFSRYKFNESKLFMHSFSDGSIVGHWDQRAHYYSKDLNRTMIVGSCLRYFSRVYGAERLGDRVSPEEGIIDQISVLNNIVSYVGKDEQGNLLFTVEAMGLELLKIFINNDPTLNDYISTKSKSFIRSLVDKTLGRKSVDEFLNEHNYSLFDKDKISKMLLGDYSFTPVVWLMSKGTKWLEKHANLFCGKTLLFYVNSSKDVKIVKAL